MMKRIFHIKRIVAGFNAMNQREKLLVIVSAVGLGLFALVQLYTLVDDQMQASRVGIVQGTRNLDEVNRSLRRYQQLSARLKRIEDNFAQSEMSVDQVYSELDRIVKESIGGENYDLKRSPTATSIGPNSEQQDFTLRIRSLSQEQIVKLLHKLEQGKAALFLGKVDIVKNAQPGTFSATLEVSSIRKKRA